MKHSQLTLADIQAFSPEGCSLQWKADKQHSHVWFNEVVQAFSKQMAADVPGERCARAGEFLTTVVAQSEREPWWSFFNTIGVCVPWLYEHSIEVALLSVMMGHALGYKETQLHELAVGAILHDVGKMRIPQRIITKPAALDETEWRMIRQHPALGVRLLASYNLPAACRMIVAQHHERLDGSGYPQGLKQERIHEGAQIVMIADSLSAMTSSRPYKKCVYSFRQSLAMLEAEQEQYSLRLVLALKGLLIQVTTD